jgi:hypothetical protein
MRLPRDFWVRNNNLQTKVRYWERQLVAGRADRSAVERYVEMAHELSTRKREERAAMLKAKEDERLRLAAEAAARRAAEPAPSFTIDFE